MSESVLESATTLIHGARQFDYGPPSESFGRIAELWSGYLSVDVTAHDVAMMMILLKVARARASITAHGEPQPDSLVDIAGYAGCSELISKDDA